MRILRNVSLVLGVLVLTASVASAQEAVTSADISRLEATATHIDQQITPLRQSDPTLAAQSQQTLSNLKDDITYLRVKLRREGGVTRTEYADVRDRLETLRVKVEGQQRVFAQTANADETPTPGGTVPVGTVLNVRLQASLNSGTAKAEQRFEATTVDDFTQNRAVLIPAGSVVRGFVSSVNSAGKIDRTGSLTLSFDEIVIGPRISRIRASVLKALDPKVGQDATRIGTGAAVGAIIGGLLGGGKGALLGVLIGGGGTIASTEGSDVDLPAGTILQIRLDEPLEIAAP